MAISDFFFGKPAQTEQIPAFTPQQEQYLNQILQLLQNVTPGAGRYLQDLFSDDPEALERFAAPAKREFEEQIVPSIAERFAGTGSLSSSGFQQSIGQAGAGLAERLTAMREGLRGQGLGALQGLQGLGLGARPFGYMQRGRQPGFIEGLLGVLGGR